MRAELYGLMPVSDSSDDEPISQPLSPLEPEPQPPQSVTHVASSSSVVPTEPPATVPLTMYQELLREVDRLFVENGQLSEAIDDLYESIPTDSTFAGRLRSLIELCERRLASLPRPKSS